MDLGKVKFGLYFRPTNVREQIRHAQLAEKYGWDSVWKQDHFMIGGPQVNKPEVWTTLTSAGLSTNNLTVGSCINCQHRAHPVKFAQMIATVDQVLKGRVMVGMGAGEVDNVGPLGFSSKGWVEKLREVITIMKALWSREEGETKYFDFDGDFFTLKKSYIQETPYQKGGPKILVGAFGPKMLKLAGELGDGWLPFGHSPKTYKEKLNGEIKQAAEAAGRSLDDIYTLHESGIKIGDSEEVRQAALFEARRVMIICPEIVKQVIPGFEHPGRAYTMAYGYGEDRDPEVFDRVGEKIPEDLALQHTFWGDADKLIETTEEFAKSGCYHHIWGPRDPTEVESVLKYVGEKVIPYFRDHQK